MNWKIEIDEDAHQALKKMDKQIAARIIAKLEKLSKVDEPKRKCKPLSGMLYGLWRYRVCNYRVICDIKEDTFVILALHVGHKGKIYGTKQ